MINLRSSYKSLSVSQGQSISNISIRKRVSTGFYGHSTIKHDYNLKTIKGDKVVVDNATGLMWHQNGSDKKVKWKKVQEWINEFNSRKHVRYTDWRLPTAEEAASLLEPSKKNGNLYIDPIFSNRQKRIWTGDKFDSPRAWCVHFGSGHVSWYGSIPSHYVRPVRSVE